MPPPRQVSGMAIAEFWAPERKECQLQHQKEEEPSAMLFQARQGPSSTPSAPTLLAG